MIFLIIGIGAGLVNVQEGNRTATSSYATENKGNGY